MAAIDIGAAAIDRPSDVTSGQTRIALDNPADGTGTIDTIEIWAVVTMGGCKVGTFSGTAPDFTSRGVETIGTVASGSKQTFSGLDIDVVTGDYVGTYYSSGSIERDTTGFADMFNLGGDQFGTGEQTYTQAFGDAISLFGTGATIEVVAVGGSPLAALIDAGLI